jgi:hypothetical protein
MVGIQMQWSEIPRGAKAYIIYHTLIAPQTITWILLPLYMIYSGYSILKVGLFFTAINVASIPLTYLIGRIFNKYPLKTGLILINILEGAAYISYGSGTGKVTTITLSIGRIIDKISEMFYPIYRAYEQIIYPKDKYEEIFTWHLRLPGLSRIVTLPIFGYILGYIYNEPKYYRMTFIGFGLYTLLITIYIRYFLPDIKKKEEIASKEFTFKTNEFKFLILFETLLTLAWALAPEIVLINYIVFVLHKTVFEVTLIAVTTSLASILATYVSEKVPKEKGLQVIGAGMILNAVYASVMALSPPLWLVILAYALGEFGDTLWFPFYRAWMFKLIPKERASEIHATISSYRKLIALLAPFVSGVLATIKPTLPYATSLVLFLSIGALFIILRHKTKT